MKKILIVTYNLHSMGGIQRSTSNIANGLSRSGYEVNIISISPGTIPMDHPLDRGIAVTTCNKEISPRQKMISTSFGQLLRKTALSVFRYWKPRNMRFVKPQQEGISTLRNELRKYDFDETTLLVTDVNSMDYVNAALAEIPGSPPALIGQYKGSVAALSRSQLNRILDTYSNLDLLLALTPEDASLLQSQTRVLTDWIANPIPSAPPALKGVDKKPRFVTMGRFAPEKGLYDALKAWKIASQSLPGWELIMYGDGPLRPDIERAIHKYGLQATVRMAGQTTDPLHALSAATALILPSEHEGFGMVIAEAASTGTPTIAYSCSPGVRMQIESGTNGILVPPKNNEALAEAMQEIASNPDLANYLGQNAKKIVERFSVEKTIEGWGTLFEIATKNRDQRISKK